MSLQSRAIFVCGCFGMLFTGLSTRLVQLAVDDSSSRAEKAEKAYSGKATVFARRGEIRDVNGEVLARNEPLKTVIVDASLLYELEAPDRKGAVKVKYDERDRVTGVLANSLGLKFEEIRARFEPDSKTGKFNRYIVIKQKIAEHDAQELEMALIKSKIELLKKIAGSNKQKLEKATAIENARTLADANIQGITFKQECDRIYPVGTLLAHVVGFYGYIPKYDGKGNELPEGRFGGVEGVENSMNQWLTGLDGQRFFQKDANGRELVAMGGASRAPKHGAHVRLTVDLGLQQIVEEEMDAACLKLKPKRACVLMMDPMTGEIMAMANRPVYNPNFPKLAKPDEKLNFAVSGAYELGSTFKTMTAAGALNCGKVTIDQLIFCENGRLPYKGGVLKDHHNYGFLSVADIIAKSSNIGAVKLALGLGQEKFYTIVRDFGFGSRTGIALPNETRGMLAPVSSWTPSSMYHIPMGHEVAASPLQIVAATSAIANGGKLMMPQIVRDITDDEGNIIAEYKPQVVKDVVVPKTAAAVSSALEKVTSRLGTAIKARVPGFRVAGKTGTAQIFDHKLKKYSNEDHIVSFVGYMPVEAPRFCMIVIIDDSATVNGSADTGGQVAAPIFAKIAERAAAHLNMQPDAELLEDDMSLRKQLAKEGRL